MLLRTPVRKTAITSLLRGKLLTAVSCSCLPVNNFAIFAKNIHERFPTCVSKICIVISVVPWRCPLGDNRNFDWRVSLLIQWKWPVRQRTGLTKNAGHPSGGFSVVSLPGSSRLWGLLSRFPRLKTAKLRRLLWPLHPLGISNSLCGGGMDIFWNHTFQKILLRIFHWNFWAFSCIY